MAKKIVLELDRVELDFLLEWAEHVQTTGDWIEGDGALLEKLRALDLENPAYGQPAKLPDLD